MMGRRVVVAICAVVVWLSHGTVFGYSTDDATLTQTVQPITCVYTTTVNGSSTSSSTDCDSLIAATLEQVEPREGRPLLSGTLSPTDVTSFRVWVGGVWFTLGASPYLSVSAGEWTLDLSTLGTPLAAGEYTIVLEERILTNFLLRSVYEDALDIPVVEITRTDTNDGRRVTTTLITPDGDIVGESILQPDFQSQLRVPSPDAQYLVLPNDRGLVTSDTVFDERAFWQTYRDVIGILVVLTILVLLLLRKRIVLNRSNKQ